MCGLVVKRMSLLSLFRCAPSLSPGGSIRRNVLNYVSGLKQRLVLDPGGEINKKKRKKTLVNI